MTTTNDIDNAIDEVQKALSLNSLDEVPVYQRFHQLGELLIGRFQVSSLLDDLHGAIRNFQDAIDLAPLRNPAWINDPANALRTQYDHTEDQGDVQRVISLRREALSLIPEDDPSMSDALFHLGSALHHSFGATEDQHEIEESISYLRRTISLTPDTHHTYPDRLNSLATALESKFMHTGELEEIQDAIAVHRRAIQLTPEGSPDLADRLDDLSRAMVNRSTFTGEVVDITEVVALKEKLVGDLQDDDSSLPNALRSLAKSLQDLVNYTTPKPPNTNDILEKARAAAQRAITHVADEDAIKPELYHSLARTSFTKFLISNDIRDIQDVVSAMRRAITYTPVGHPHRAPRLIFLAVALRRLSRLSGALSDIEASISAQQRAIRLFPEGHSALPIWYHGLGHGFRLKFNHTRDIADIQSAIDAQEKVVRDPDQLNIDIAEYYSTLGEYYLARFHESGIHEDLASAVSSFRAAALSPIGPPLVRLQSARKWAHWSRSYDIDLAMEAFHTAIDLLSVFVGFEQTQHTRHRNISEISNLSLSAAALAFEASHIARAVEWLERGRCLVWSQLNNLRMPLNDLQVTDAALADKLVSVSKVLEGSAGAQRILTSEAGAADHIDHAVEWRKLINAVRQIPGFEAFLLPTPLSTLLKGLPTTGSVVVINVHADRCDAVALRGGEHGGVIHIPLPALSFAKARALEKQFRKQLDVFNVRMRGYELGAGEVTRDERGVRRMGTRSGIRVALAELRTTVVEPILKEIGYIYNESDTKQRIWWCGTGPLTFLPLHAAGLYGPGQRGNVASDYAISSYIPNLATLINCNEIPSHATNSITTGVFMVSQPQTPGMAPLPGTTREIQTIQTVLEEHQIPCLSLSDSSATSQTGIDNMVQYTCVHLACHAIQDSQEPLESGLFLYDQRLSLSTIIKHDLKNADLAFLSACQTSQGDEVLSEESVHLAAGMLAAGYRGVVATMWSIKDEHAPGLAKNFYKELLTRSGATTKQGEETAEVREFGSSQGWTRTGIDGLHAADALHHAVQQLRRQIGDSDEALMTWIPYVHFGR